MAPALRTQLGHANGIFGRKEQSDVTACHAGAKEIKLDQIRGHNLTVVIGCSGHGGGAGGDVESCKCSVFFN